MIIDRFYYHPQRSNMTYDTNNITFHVIHEKVSNDSRCSRNSCKDWAWSKIYRKHGRILLEVEHCIKL